MNAVKEDIWVVCLAEKDTEDRVWQRQAERQSHTSIYGLS